MDCLFESSHSRLEKCFSKLVWSKVSSKLKKKKKTLATTTIIFIIVMHALDVDKVYVTKLASKSAANFCIWVVVGFWNSELQTRFIHGGNMCRGFRTIMVERQAGCLLNLHKKSSLLRFCTIWLMVTFSFSGFFQGWIIWSNFSFE